MFETKMKRASVPARPDQKVRYSPYPVYWIVGGFGPTLKEEEEEEA